MKTAILYVSIHHGNTKKVAEAMAEELSADLFDLNKTDNINLSSYDCIGLASGCFFQKMHEKIRRFVHETDFLPGQKVFLICTAGLLYRDYTKEIRAELLRKGVEVSGSFQCRGFDTYGFLEKIGGIAKGHPNNKDLQKARAFAKNLY